MPNYRRASIRQYPGRDLVFHDKFTKQEKQ